MQFDKNELKVPVGEPVVLTLTHNGKMAKNVLKYAGNIRMMKKNITRKKKVMNNG